MGDEQHYGTIQWYDPEQKYGFIKDDGGGTDPCFHDYDIDRLYEPVHGDRVSFKREGNFASYVEKIS